MNRYVEALNIWDRKMLRGAVRSKGDGTYNLTLNVDPGSYQMVVQLASGVDGIGDGLTGCYFTNRWLHGDCIMTRIDRYINFNWGTELITPTAKDYVSVRWTGFVQPPYSGAYTFEAEVEDGARLYIDNHLIIDQWLSAPATYSASYTFPAADMLYKIRFEYRENSDNAKAVLRWSHTNITKEVIPQNYLFSSAYNISGNPFEFLHS